MRVEQSSNQSLAGKRSKVMYSAVKYRMSVGIRRMQVSAAGQSFDTTAIRSCPVDPATI